ncbi:COR domain-containing protein [Runella sp. MFBS21]|uniref:COR domain-containing protein n=1 Tax=Runella sp. MFBS21 TaxID=3034018 RepID=UPI0023F7A059|nr:COR domain-containing protein [Runella sp. MFBS21]MDF7815944.1 COR domain-containing protein [Runella sp. MFBS21]
MLHDLIQTLTLQKDDGPITAVRLVKGYDNSYAINAAGQLTALSIGNSKLKKLVLGKDAEVLEYLYLSGSESLTEIIFEVPLPRLTRLYLNNCAIKEITIPKGFRSLQQIYLQKNRLTKLVFEGDCPVLVLLDVSENQLDRLSFHTGFRALKYIYADKNTLKRIIFNRSMRLLNTLHLAQNQLTELAPFLSEVETMETLYLQGNQLRRIDREIWDTDRNCWNTMKGYLTSLNKANFTKEYLHEAKMILIGNGEVGKTSIRLKLLDINAPLPAKEDRTPGLDIVPYTIANLPGTQTGLPESTSFTFNIWDFGGQGKYREIQQLFCSRKSLYLYVTSYDDTVAHNELYIGYEYWLAMANAYNNDSGQHSPVIYVQNKNDIGKRSINEEDVKNKFGNVEEFIKISCVDIEQFAALPKLIAKSISKISDDIFTVQYSSEWLGAKEDLNQLKSQGTNYISKEEFITVCTRRGLNADEIRAWLAVLDRIGAVIYFGDNEKLKDWIVLNPIWVKDAICKVIDFEFYDDIATLKPDFLPKIWKEYNEREREKLLELLISYHFCYEEKGNFIVPALFTEKQPNYPPYLADFDCEIKLTYSPFLPAGTLHKFMVKLHSKIYNELRWKKGVVLHDGATNTYAEVTERWQEHSIYIRLKDDKGQHPLWEEIQKTLLALNDDLKTTKLMPLDFEVYCFYNNKWKAKADIEDVCMLDSTNIFRFMFDLPTPTKEYIPKQPIPLPDKAKLSIIFLTADPENKNHIRAPAQKQIIADTISDAFEFYDNLNTKYNEIGSHTVGKDIVHITVHGIPDQLFFVHDEHKERPNPVPSDYLCKQLEKTKEVKELILLIACDSETSAKKIVDKGLTKYAVGTTIAISPKAAVDFSEKFYKLLKKSPMEIESVFEYTCYELNQDKYRAKHDDGEFYDYSKVFKLLKKTT